MSKICVFLAEGMEEIEALTVVDICRRAQIDTKTVSVTEDRVVTSSHAVKVEADMILSEVDVETLDMIVLPGGMPGTTNLEESAKVIDAIVQAMVNNTLIGAICAAPSILGICGCLKGRKATCFPGFEEYLDGANILDERVVRDGNIITAKGMGCATEFALCIIQALAGKEKADEIAISAIIR
jgi:4-methyl-5(b-hydroxyethyl)-thiazole monophosphate biosynthesis